MLYDGVPYEYFSVAPDGALVFTAGACPLDEHGVVAEPGDYEAQARRCLDNLTLALERAGSDLRHVLKTTVFVVGAQPELVRVWNLVAERFAPARPPSTLLGVAALGYTGQLVEIEAVASRNASPGAAAPTPPSGAS
jgi:enamine deaminase RidA (YjgF/YER057c/UK114 family)